MCCHRDTSGEAQTLRGYSGLLLMIKIISPRLFLGSVLMIKTKTSGTHVYDQKHTSPVACLFGVVGIYLLWVGIAGLLKR